MPTTKDLFDDFVSSRTSVDPGPDDRGTGDTFRISEHQLIEVVHGEPHIVAGWEQPGSTEAVVWIANEFQGWARRSLDEKLRDARLVVMTVLPPDDFDDGTDIIWWGYPVECMSCGDTLVSDQRELGLCTDCADLRKRVDLEVGEVETFGIQQQRGIRGAPLPKSRPGSR